MNRISQIREALNQQQLQGEITETQLLDVLRSLPTRPTLGAPAHADDSKDFGMELLTLTPEQRTALGLTVRTTPIRPSPSLRETDLDQIQHFNGEAEEARMTRQTVETEVESESVKLTEQQRLLQSLEPRLRIRVHALACRNDNGRLSNGSNGQSQQELREAISKTIAAANEIFQGTNVELVFYPAADLEIRNDTRFNQDFVIPASEQGKLTQQPPLSESEIDALCNRYSTTAYRNGVARQYKGKMVLLFAEGTTRFFDASNQRWVISSPSGGGFSWEDLEFAKLSAGVGNSAAAAESYATFLAHEVGHYLHLWHPFYQISLTAAENANRTLTDRQKATILSQRVTDVLNKEITNGVPANQVVKVLDADASVVSDTPPDDSGELLHYLNRVANGGDACGTVGEVNLTLNNGLPVNYKPDRSLVMSYFKGCLNFEQHFSSGQTKRMRNALVNGNRRHLVGVQLGDTSWPKLRLSGLWNVGTQSQVWWPMCSEQQFRDKTGELWGSMRIKQLRGFVLGGQVWYSVLWESGQYGQVWWPNCSEQDFRNKTGELWNSMRPAQVHAFVVGNEVRYSCLWNQGTHGQIWWPNCSEQDFRNKTGEIWNWARPKQVQAFVVSGQIRYSCLWDAGTHAQVWWPNCSEQDFRNKTGETWSSMRPAQLQPFLVNGQVRFSCLWNAGTHAQVWWPLATEEQVRQKTGDLWESMRPFNWQPIVF
jgi:hypothetical protein